MNDTNTLIGVGDENDNDFQDCKLVIVCFEF